MRPYCIDNVDYLCPMCIANGEAARKFDAEFVQGAEWTGEPDEEKNKILFYQTPGYLSCRENIGFHAVMITVPIWGQ